MDPIQLIRSSAPLLTSIASRRAKSPPTFECKTPTKYQLIINLKTAKELRIEVPAVLPARADEVIE
jgi:putative ABC transport system substrate-binding protein